MICGFRKVSLNNHVHHRSPLRREPSVTVLVIRNLRADETSGV
jgi:hypothetical protein